MLMKCDENYFKENFLINSSHLYSAPSNKELKYYISQQITWIEEFLNKLHLHKIHQIYY